MAAKIQIVASNAQGTEVIDYKPGAKFTPKPGASYKILVDGKEQLPAGTKIYRKGKDLFIELSDGDAIHLGDWCDIAESRLTDLDNATALDTQGTSYVALKEVSSGSCLMTDPAGAIGMAVGEPPAAVAVPAAKATGGAYLGAILGGVALLGAAAGSGGGGGDDGPRAPARPSGTLSLDPGSDSGTSQDGRTNDATPTLVIPNIATGQSARLYVNGTAVAAAFDAATGRLTPTQPLPDGAYQLAYTVADAAGVESPLSNATSITIDTTAPVAPAQRPALDTASDTGTPGDGITSDATPTVGVSAPAAGETPVLLVDGVVVPSRFDSATNTLTPVSALPDGARTIATALVDSAGNQSAASAPLTITIDTAAPAAPPAPNLAAASDSGSADNDDVTSVVTPTFSGSGALANATITLYDGAIAIGSTTADGSGAWSLTLAAALGAGVRSITARQTSIAGVQSAASAALAVTIDVAGPSFADPAPVNQGFASFVLGSTSLSATDDVTPSADLEVVSAAFRSSSTFNAGDLTFSAPAGGAITVTNAAPGKTGTVVIAVTMRDAAGNVTTRDVTLSVVNANDAPAGADATLSTNEDTPLVLTAANFGFSDPNDTPANALAAVLVNAPTAGRLELSGVLITAQTSVTVADIAAGRLVFTPGANANGTGYASISFAVQDDGGTANGGVDTDASPNTLTIDVTAVDDAPVAASSTITVNEESIDTALGLTAPTDVDSTTLTITVTGLPTVGTVTLADGTAVANGATLTAAELAGLLYDAPAELAAATSTSFTYTVSDGTSTVTGTATINVNPVNDLPVVASSTITVDEESADTALGLAAPTDVDSTTLTITVTGLPTVGTVTLADGTAVANGATLTAAELAGLLYDAPADLAAATITSFTYSVSDGTSTVTGTATINVNPVNDAPVAASSTITVNEESIDTALGLTAPTDVDSTTLTITVTGLPTVGTVTLADGTVVANGATLTAAELADLLYDAPAELAAATSTSFTYTVSDGTSTVTGTATINVNPVNDLPVVVSSTITVNEESADTALGLTAPTDVDSTTLTITVTGLPTVGTVTLADGTAVANGATLTAAELAGLLYDAPADLAAATITSFTYTVSDGTSTVTGTTTINVNPVNDAPVAASSTITVNEESIDTALGLTAPTDVDSTTLTITVTGLPTVGTVTLADGTVVANGATLTAAELAGLLYDAPAELAAATSTSFTYTVDDGVAPAVTGTATINVNPVNDLPVAASSTITVDEESTDTALGLAAPTDVDSTTLTITVTGLPTVGTVTLADGTAVANGAILTAAELAGLLYDAPAELAAATSTSFTYTVSDGTSTVTGTATINVNPVNDLPVAASSTITVDEESTDTALGLAAPTDVDSTTLTITVTGLPTVGTVTLADGIAVANGATLTAAELVGLLYDAPADLAAAISTSFTYSVSDGTSTVTGTTTINVNPVNDAPVAASSTITVNEESIDTALGLTAPTDVDSTTLTITVTGLPTVGTVTLADGTVVANGATLTAAELADLLYDAPTELAAATSTSFTYTVDDGVAPAVTGTATINVNPVNDLPVAASSTITVDEESTDTALGLAAPTDVDSTTLTITVTGLPTVGTVTLADGTAVANGATLTAAELAGLLYDAPADLAAATITSFTYTVSDGTSTVTGTTTINVNPVNDAPVAASSTITVNEESIDTALGLTAPTDVDSTTLTITVTGLPTVGTVTLADGTAVANGATLTAAELAGLLYDAPVDLAAATSTSFTYTVSDGTSTVTGTTTINVNPVNDAPVAASSTITVNEESTDTALGLTAPTDVDSTTLTITVTGLPTVGTVTLADGNAVANGAILTAAELAGLLYDAPAELAAATTTSFTYTVSDGTSTVTGTTTINVNPVNDLPINTVPTAVTAVEDTVFAFTGINAISVADADEPDTAPGNRLASTQLSVTSGTLNVTLSGAATISAGVNGSATLTISGNQADINATLGTLTYQGNFSFSGTDTLTVVSSDGNAGVDTDTVTINVTNVNNVPVINVVAGDDVITAPENAAGAVTITGTGEANATVTLVVAGQTYTTTANASGVWSQTLPSVLPVGAQTISATQTSGGTTSSAVSRTVSVTADATPTTSYVLQSTANFDAATGTYTVSEGATSIQVQVVRVGNTSFASTVDIQAQGLTAVAGTDFSLAPQTVSFAAGEISQTVTLNITQDTFGEGNENLRINLINPSANTTLATGSINVQIQDDDNTYWSVSTQTVGGAVDEGAGTLVYTVSRTGDISAATTITFSTIGGTAAVGADYTAASQVLSFAAGQASQTVSVAITEDTTVETNETVVASITGPSVGVIATGTASGVINDNEQSIWSVSASTSSVGESAGNAVFTISRTGRTDAETIVFATTGGTATAGSDYTAVNQTVSFAAGETSRTINVAILDDTIAEPNQTFNGTIRGASNGSVLVGSATTTILDNDQSIWSITGGQRVDESVGTMSYTISRTGATGAATIQLITAGGSAVAGTDYAAVNQTVTFAAGETSKTITVAITNDTSAETDETVVAIISNPSSGDGTSAAVLDSISADTAINTITDNDQSNWSISGPATVDEGSGVITYTVTRTGATNASTIVFGTAGGSATTGDATVTTRDFIPANQTLSFAEGEMSRTVILSIVDDTRVEPNETIVAAISNASGGNIVAGSVTTTILDNEQSVWSVAADSAIVDESAGTLSFVVSRTGASNAASIVFSPGGGTASVGSDYTAGNQTLSFAAGEMSRVVTVALVDDTESESNEVVGVTISAPSSGTIAAGAASTTILDNEQAVWYITPGAAISDEGAGLISFTVSRTGRTDAATINIATAGGNASTPSDFAAINQTLSFAEGETAKTVTVALVDDTLAEANETITALISSASAGTVATTTATSVITDNDQSIWSIVATSGSSDEGSGLMTYVVSRTGATNAATISFAITGGSAGAGSDFVPADRVLSFAEGQMSQTITVTINDDPQAEANESVTAVISSASEGSIQTAAATNTILDNDQSVWVITGGLSTDEGAGFTTYTVSRTGGANAATIDIGTTQSFSTAGIDYVGLNTTLSFADGEMVKTVNVTLIDDAVPEGTDSIAVRISNTSSGTIVPGQGVAFNAITDNDSMQWSISAPTSNSSEAAGSMAYTVSRTGGSAAATIDFFVLGGSATLGADYTGVAARTLNFAAGQLSQTITIGITDDLVGEGNETINAHIDNASIGNIFVPTVATTIADNDQSFWSVAALSAGPLFEDVGSVSFVVSRTGALGADTIRFFTSGGSAVAGVDYTAVDRVLTFAAGQTSQVVTVAISEDTDLEFTESIAVTITEQSSGAITGPSSSINFTDNDQMIWSSSVASNSDEGSGTYYIVVTRTGTNLVPATIQFATLGTQGGGNSTIPGLDYVPVNTTLVFGAGEATKLVPITIIDDTLPEPFQEVIATSLSNPSVGVLGTGNTTNAIFDNDGVGWGIAPAIAGNDEGGGFVIFAITRTGSLADTAATIDVFHTGGTATPGVDFVPIPYQTLTFAPGETRRTVRVQIIDDAIYEPVGETIGLGIANPSTGGGFGAATTFTITDNEIAPPYSWNVVGNGAVAESAAYMTFTVSRTAADVAATIDIASVGNSAVALGRVVDGSTQSDYTALPRTTLSFAVGEFSRTIRVNISEDTLVEANENVTVAIGNASSGNIATPAASNAIVDNDAAVTTPVMTWFVGTNVGALYTEGEAQASFIISRSSAATAETVQFATIGGSSIPGSEYTPVAPVTLSFAVGETIKTVFTPRFGDSNFEVGETIVGTIGNASTGNIGTGTVTYTINEPATTSTRTSVSIGASTTGQEDAGVLLFTVSRGGDISGTTTVEYFLNGGTATAGVDYTSIPDGTVTFAPGFTSAIVAVPVLADAVVDPGETVIISLRNPSAGVFIGTRDAAATIADNDTAAAGLAAGGYAFNSPGSPLESSGTMAVYITRSAQLVQTGPTTTYFRTVQGADGANAAATPGVDYTALTQTITWAPGETQKVVLINITDDALAEGAENIRLEHSEDAAFGSGVLVGNLAIANDDTLALPATPAVPGLGVPTYGVVVAATNVLESNGTVAFFVTRGTNTTTPSTSYFRLGTSGTATAGADFVNPGDIVLLWGAGETTKTVFVSLTNDTTVETPETIVAQIATDPGFTTGLLSATLTVLDNDAFTGSTGVDVVTLNATMANGTLDGVATSVTTGTVVNTGEGNDTVISATDVATFAAFADVDLGGGNDRLEAFLSTALLNNAAHFEGGAGVDTIALSGTQTYAIGNVGTGRVLNGFEVIDLGIGNQTLTMSLLDIGEITRGNTTANTLRIASNSTGFAGTSDTLVLDLLGRTLATPAAGTTIVDESGVTRTVEAGTSGNAATNEVVIDGNRYDVYQVSYNSQNLTLLVDTDVALLAPTYTVAAPASVLESNGAVAFTITRGTNIQFASTSYFRVGPTSTATAGTDYVDPGVVTLSWADGETSKTITVQLTNDSNVESAETLVGQVSTTTTFATIAAAFTSTILDDETFTGTTGVDVVTLNATTLVGTLDGVTPVTVTVGNVANLGDGNDRLITNAAIAASPAAVQVDLGAGNDNLEVAAVGPAALLATNARFEGGAGVDTINLNVAGTYNVNSVTATRGLNGFEVIDLGAGNQILQMSLADIGEITRGNTTANTLRIASSGGVETLTLDTLTRTFSTPAAGATVVDETGATLTVEAGTGGNAAANEVVIGANRYDVYQFSYNSQTVTLLVDTDVVIAAPTYAIAAPVTNVLESAGSVSYTITRGANASFASTSYFRVNPTGTTAVAGVDYVDPGVVTLSWAPGETTKTVTVQLTDDPTVEVAETLAAQIATNLAFTGATAAPAVTIQDDDTFTGTTGVDVVTLNATMVAGTLDGVTPTSVTVGNAVNLGDGNDRLINTAAITGNASFIQVDLGAGDDVLEASGVGPTALLLNGARFQGGAGADTINLNVAGTYNLTSVTAARVLNGFEVIDLTTGSQTLQMSLADIGEITRGNTTANTLRIASSGGTDTLTLDTLGTTFSTPAAGATVVDETGATLTVEAGTGGNAAANEVVIGANRYDVYQFSYNSQTVTLLVDTDVVVPVATYTVTAPLPNVLESAGSVSYTVTRGTNTAFASTSYFRINPTGTTAVAGADYVDPGVVTLSWAVGETSKTVTVQLTNDSAAEVTETLIAQSATNVGFTTGITNAAVTIQDEDTFTGTTGVDVATLNATMPTGTLNGVTPTSVNVGNLVNLGDGNDRLITNVSIAANAPFIQVDLGAGDDVLEASGVGPTALLAAGARFAGGAGFDTVNLNAAGTYNVSSVTATRGLNGFEVIDLGAGNQILQMSLADIGEITRGNTTANTLRIASSAGVDTLTLDTLATAFSTPAAGATVVDETGATLTVEAGTGGNAAANEVVIGANRYDVYQFSYNSQAVTLLVDTDVVIAAPTYAIAAPVTNVLESAGSVSYTITRGTNTSFASASYFRVGPTSTATAGADYVDPGVVTLSWAPGETTKTVTVQLTDDSTAEGAETLAAQIATNVGFTLGLASAPVVTIQDDDTFTGTTGADVVTLNTGAVGNVVNLGDGNDTLISNTSIAGNAAFVRVDLGAGDDSLEVPSALAAGQTVGATALLVSGARVSGGAGVDTINLVYDNPSPAPESYSISSVAAGRAFNGFEIINLGGAPAGTGNQALLLSLQDVLDITSGNAVANTLRIDSNDIGGAGNNDLMTLNTFGFTFSSPTAGATVTDVTGTTYTVEASTGGNASANEVVIGANRYDVLQYTYNGVLQTLLVDTDVPITFT